jgi:hypothetical protein
VAVVDLGGARSSPVEVEANASDPTKGALRHIPARMASWTQVLIDDRKLIHFLGHSLVSLGEAAVDAQHRFLVILLKGRC